MNIDITNIDYYRVTSHGGRLYELFNRNTDTVKNITSAQYAWIKENRSIEACDFVERTP